MNKCASFVFILAIFLASTAYSEVTVKPLATVLQKQSREVGIILRFSDTLTGSYQPENFMLATKTEQLMSNKVTISSSGLTMTLQFEVNSASFAILERLVTNGDSANYFIKTNTILQTKGGDTINADTLQKYTMGKIHTIARNNWNEYILGEYSTHYLFPQKFHIGTQINNDDSVGVSYYLEIQESKSWVSLISNLSLNWGLEGRISTSKTDSLAYAKIYPIIVQFNETASRGAFMAGVETGNQGFGKLGRVTLKGVYQCRLQYNPLNFTLGFPRWRINPIINLSVQGSTYWSDTVLPDSLKKSFDATLAIRYDIPVGKNYYLQTNVQGNYSTLTKKLQYLYDFSFGYIVDGSIQVLAMYRQGYQNVTYTFDKQLLLGIAVSAINSNIGK